MIPSSGSVSGSLLRGLRRISALCCLCLCLGTGCDDGDSDAGAEDGGAGGATGGAGGTGGASDDPREVFGEPPAALDEMADARDAFPMIEGAEWRYALATDDPTMAGPLATPSVVTVRKDGNDWIRETRTTLETELEGEATPIDQRIEETFQVQNTGTRTGPRILVKKIITEETLAGQPDQLVRRLTRRYSPPYRLFEDVWRPAADTPHETVDSRVIETRELPDDDEAAEPREFPGVTIIVEAEGPKTLVVPDGFLEDVYEINVSDDPNGLPSRTYWVKPGVGVVQWLSREATNVTFSLVESNVEAAPAAE